MRSALPQIAEQLGADERTLRRAAERGTLRARRPSPRRLELEAGELAYLRAHWDQLNRLVRTLRTEPNVSLAVLCGSFARGDERQDSDIDVLVGFRTDHPGASARLARRLEAVTARPVDVARLSRVRESAPLLVLAALEEGRVLVDRDGGWRQLREARPALLRAARRRARQDRADAATSVAQLTEEL